MINKHKQKGAETVEFAMIALLFFAVLFAIIEFSRALFVWNALTEATREARGWRLFVPIKALFQSKLPFLMIIAGSLGTSPIIGGLTPAMVSVRYLNLAGTVETDQTLDKVCRGKQSRVMHTI